MPFPQPHTEQVRSFNRFYTKQIGLLREGFLKTPFSLTQARVLYELGRRPGIRSTQLVEELGLDPGYLSRLLKSFEKQGLLRRSNSKDDGRVSHLSLTARGRREFAALNARSEADISQMLATLSDAQQQRLVDGMNAIREMLGSRKVAEPAFRVRTHRPGDIGWVIARHGELYAQEYGWDSSFEGLVAEIAGKFLTHFDARCERCWIAERGTSNISTSDEDNSKTGAGHDGERLGCIFLVRQSSSIAKLRLFLVEPSARGMGVGTRLVKECLEFARKAGYRKVTLWTNDILHAARRIYERAGFRLVKEEKHHSFGHDLVGQFWELKL